MAVVFWSSRPTPATCSFTVRSSRLPSTLASLVLHRCLMGIRVAFGCLILILLWSKWSAWPFEPLICASQNTGLFCSPLPIIANIPWSYVLPGGLLGLWVVTRRGYIEENLLVLRGLGVQTSTSSSMYLFPPNTRFIPTTNVQDMFIHEAFKGFEVRYYLSIIVVGEEDAHVVFPALLPRRKVIEEVWRGARDCLYEPKT